MLTKNDFRDKELPSKILESLTPETQAKGMALYHQCPENKIRRQKTARDLGPTPTAPLINAVLDRENSIVVSQEEIDQFVGIHELMIDNNGNQFWFPF